VYGHTSPAGRTDAFAEHGLRVPAGMSVAGYDNTPVAALRAVSLTTAGLSRRVAAILAVACLSR
jgi:DNA-binding LacI/PurR family transcriptional regulator